MANQRATKRDDAVDAARTINWFRTLCEYFGEERPRHIQRALDPDSLGESAYGKKISNSKFKLYADGKHVPGAAFVEKVDQVVKNSSRALNHVLWRVLREQGPIRKYAKGWVQELVPEIQSIVFAPDYELRLRGDRHYLGSLERRASADGLAALTILLKLSIEAGDVEQAWNFAHSIFKVLLIIGPELDELTIGERVFDLYVVRIFSLVSCNGMVMDLEELGGYPSAAVTIDIGSHIALGDVDEGGFRIASILSKDAKLAGHSLQPWRMHPDSIPVNLQRPTIDGTAIRMRRYAIVAGWPRSHGSGARCKNHCREGRIDT